VPFFLSERIVSLSPTEPLAIKFATVGIAKIMDRTLLI